MKDPCGPDSAAQTSSPQPPVPRPLQQYRRVSPNLVRPIPYPALYEQLNLEDRERVEELRAILYITENYILYDEQTEATGREKGDKDNEQTEETGRRPCKRWTEKRRKRQACNMRRNAPWKKSTGPRTAEGKARVAQNARKHGRRSSDAELQRAIATTVRGLLEDEMFGVSAWARLS